MKRKLYLEGELAQKYGRVFEMEVDTFQDALRLLNANFPDFKKYLIDCHDNGVGFVMDVGSSNIEREEDLLLPAGEGDMVITPMPAGAKSAGAKILAAIAVVAIVALSGGFAALSAAYTAGTMTLGASLALSGLMIATQLAIAGIMQLMAPDPATDSAAPQAYLFNGSEQNIIEGDPVPILYGELRVPGRPISIGIINNTYSYNANLNMGALGTPGNSNSSSGGNISDSEGNISYHR